jgi:hypothetical protein
MPETAEEFLSKGLFAASVVMAGKSLLKNNRNV